MKSIIELLDKTDLSDHANGAEGIVLGEIPMEYETLMDDDFINMEDGVETADPNRIAYQSSDWLGTAGFFTGEQTLTAVLATIAECLANQDEGYCSEFVIPISATDRIYLYILIDTRPE